MFLDQIMIVMTQTFKDVLEEVLPIDIACQKQKQPMKNDMLILTNPANSFSFSLTMLLRHWSKEMDSGICHFLFLQWHCNFPWWKIAIPFGLSCQGNSIYVIKFTQHISKGCQTGNNKHKWYSFGSLVSIIKTIDKPRNQENSWITGGENGNALSVQNNNRWYPIHIAAFCKLPIDIIYNMAKEAPITIVPEEHVHWNRHK